MGSRKTRYLIALLTLMGCTLSATPAAAGGGPENVFLVVNSAVRDSLTIANHFVEGRKIPTSSVFYVNWPDPPFETEIETFRSRVLAPALDAIKKRRLSRQIDYIVYSSGFPYAVNFSSDLGDTSPGQHQPKASITGATFLHEFTMRKSKQLMGSRSNAYARNVLPGNDGQSRGFRSRYGIDVMGNRVQQDVLGQQYYLSMMLGHVRGNRNNTVREVLNYLSAASRADGTEPSGTIYFVKNSNIRSAARHDLYPSMVDELGELGVKAEVIEGQGNEKDCLPVGKDDVIGAVVGFYKMAWGLTNSKILPGAIVENFTSYGGVMSGNHGQTLLSNFLKYGAVASSGTVCEPYAILDKFPHPRIHVHYARGCSVGEAFYQSVVSPYQLLIVGDPLCQPWAVAPEVQLAGLETKKPVSGTITFTATATSKRGHPIRNLEVFIDGILVMRKLPGEQIEIDTVNLSNGYHELRVVAVEDTDIETQGRAIAGFVALNEAASGSDQAGQLKGVTVELLAKYGVPQMGQPAYLRVRADHAREIRIYHGREQVGVLKGDAGRIMINPEKLGGGPVTLRPIALPKHRSQKPVFGFPLKILVPF